MTHNQRFNNIAHAELPDEGPSKSQRKRESHALQDLGEELVNLGKDALARVPMPENLERAVRDCRKITAHEGRRRQMQYVGKQMRTLHESEVEAIRRALDIINGVSKAETAKLHALERWRERLLAKDEALTELLTQHPEADAQQLRTLVRNARREQAAQKPPKAFRELFQALKDLLGTGSSRTAESSEDADSDLTEFPTREED
ncbi:MAG: ribosome biogenesis factor YjgA [Pandoraea sp.]|nr:ribosome biogenesis factor YjgA [Pandoraea sp.]MDR3396292.1 ribosome biogenesis factor YjgA [Pandoraea sp.]